MKRSTLPFLLAGAIVLASCSAPLPPPASTTPQPLASQTHTPTVTITAIRTPLPALTFTKIPSATPNWTPLPTLPNQEAKRLLEELLLDNGGCELPCIWGLVPGETPWFEAGQFLQTFLNYLGQGEGTVCEKTNFGYEFETNEGRGTLFISVENHKIEWIHLSTTNTSWSYRLDQILTRYDQPEIVYLKPQTLPFGDFIDVVLYYPKIGFSAFFSYEARVVDGQHIVCPAEQHIGPQLDTWNPDHPITIIELYPHFTARPAPAQHVDQALNMSVAEFTEQFKDGTTEKCFIVPGE